MTFWLDAHLDPKLAPWLGSRFGVIVKDTKEIGLRDATDRVLFDAARRFGGIVIVTKDHDLVDRVRRDGPPPQILWLQFGNMPTLAMQLLFSGTFAEALELLRQGHPLVAISLDRVGPA